MVRRFLKSVEERYAHRLLWRRMSEHRDPDPYYLSCALAYKTAQILLLLTLFVFTALSLIVHADQITYDNLFYFAKDLGAAVDLAQSDHNSIVYTTADPQDFALYKDGIAVAGRTEIASYTASGRKTFSQAVSSSAAQLEPLGKYLLLYDRGGRDVAVYNAFARIYHETFSYPITKAVSSPSGRFAVVTQGEHHPSSVILYDENFERLNVYNKANRVLDVAIAPDGKRVAMVSVTTREGAFEGELTVAVPGKDSVTRTLTYPGLLPLACRFLEGGGLVVVLDRGICLYDRRGELVTEAPLGTGESLVTMDLTADGAAFLLAREGAAVGQDHRLVVLNGNGEVVLDRFVSDRVRSVAVARGALFVQTPTHIKKIALSDGTEWEREQIYDGERMMVYNADNVVLFSSNKAWFVSFEGTK